MKKKRVENSCTIFNSAFLLILFHFFFIPGNEEIKKKIKIREDKEKMRTDKEEKKE